ncbi:GNAT family N-acetyltransferase [Silvanigrella aquatica]|uniref:N-acetyltransferase domain-containing protein n=1 Tax=Silvanigrella aquatica TaxID=1915309 RepID=A0A1L4CY42_9BACT|nr:GNAT family N-acetyltransferase [Silvanigrella aquatica]APJ02883.1 hypothetical protein AXG55_02680 [Silvanigrella aquatica]
MRKFIAGCENTIQKKFAYIPNRLNNCKVIKLNNFTLIQSPYKTSMFNIAWIKELNKETYQEKIQNIIDTLSPNPFALWLGPNTISCVKESQLIEMGFIKEANETGMCIELNQFNENIYESNLQSIFEVIDKEGILKFIDVLEAYDPFVRDYYLKVFHEIGLGEHQPFRFFYLSKDGKAVCIASLFFADNYCGIFDVITHEAHRKQGHANKLMKYLLSYAKKRQTDHMCLTASSPEAVYLYKKMGFIELGYYNCFEFKFRF